MCLQRVFKYIPQYVIMYTFEVSFKVSINCIVSAVVKKIVTTVYIIFKVHLLDTLIVSIYYYYLFFYLVHDPERRFNNLNYRLSVPLLKHCTTSTLYAYNVPTSMYVYKIYYIVTLYLLPGFFDFASKV